MATIILKHLNKKYILLISKLKIPKLAESIQKFLNFETVKFTAKES